MWKDKRKRSSHLERSISLSALFTLTLSFAAVLKNFFRFFTFSTLVYSLFVSFSADISFASFYKTVAHRFVIIFFSFLPCSPYSVRRIGKLKSHHYHWKEWKHGWTFLYWQHLVLYEAVTLRKLHRPTQRHRTIRYPRSSCWHIVTPKNRLNALAKGMQWA